MSTVALVAEGVRMDGVMSMGETEWLALLGLSVVATVLLTVILVAAQLAGWTRMDVPLLIGTMFVADPDKARVVGFVIHLVNGLIFAVLYTVVFAASGTSTWWTGMLFGAFHASVYLVVLVPLLPGLHPRMGSTRTGPGQVTLLEPPGFLALNYGPSTPAVTAVAHLGYGLLLGLTVSSLL